MVAICSDALLKAMSEVFGCSSAHLKGYCSDFLPNLHLQLFQIVFRSRPHNLEELKMRIREEIAAILLEMCRRAAENFRHRLQQCIATDGHHLPDAIFKK
ncbi:hypothetical protein Pcinc_008791 [Petrolisthes cinctipes]|uniref:Uncharacterized protein n=1 Tax=Petrolisthes cinctipes TaxID=88211 RepID=A0AAE1FWX8_PETCI|nr:hypothetical protein Pcinc_029616 [Petrolisthes cinctipes]KAK3880652.1 hypothetical protein Pcinc_014866 [Petrolisthes cinctipes]KAK3887104.1 hypothetical protein Pcinc_008791 [Petrolisthes cinctipes]